MNSYLQLTPAILIAVLVAFIFALAASHHIADKQAERKLEEEDAKVAAIPTFIGSRDRPSLLAQGGRR
jgi:hypothetical protein